ncbi:MAG: polysaccharide biosynthesis tyrosine autokinase [Syntrophobacterales bacterium]|jgi:capsular exopolysaccharide synthesis family protein|nr:polysaccharide biosynthesis tyrosine autokinase [Syntrophobacterales bacterium]
MKMREEVDLIVRPPSQVPDSVSMASYDYNTESETHLRDYWRVIVNRRWLVLGFCLGLVAVVTFLCFWMHPIYMSTTMPQIIQDNPGGTLGSNNPLSSLFGGTYDDNFYNTQFAVLQSRTLALRVIKDLNLDKLPEFKELREPGILDRVLFSPPKSPGQIESNMVDYFLDKLKVAPVKNSYLVNISYKCRDKEMSQKVVETVVNEFIKLNMDSRSQSFVTIKKWLENELQNLAQRVDYSTKKLVKFGKEKDIYLPDDNANPAVAKYLALSDLLTKAQADTLNKKALADQIQAKGVDAPVIVNNALIVPLRQALITQEATVQSLLKVFREGHPQLQTEQAKLKEIRGRLKAEVDRISTSVKSDYQAAVRSENFLADAFASQQKVVGSFMDNSIQYKMIKRDVDTFDSLYQGLLSRMKDASVAATMVPSNVTIIDHGNLPFKPWIPRKGLFIALSAVLGLIGGVGLAFVTEYFDNSIKTSEEMERVCRWATLGVVPLFTSSAKQPELAAQGDQKPLALMSDSMTMFAEAIHQMRTSIMLSTSGHPPKVLIVCSPNPGEGKSTISVHLAMSLTKRNEKKVVIIDADMRKPTIHRYFNEVRDPGLSTYLSGNASEEEIIKFTDIPNLWVISAGATPPNPPDLLGSSEMQALIKSLRAQFDHVVIDTPPLLGFADARILTAISDGVIMTVRHNSTAREAGKLANQVLRQDNARVIGGVLNYFRVGRGSGGYYYGYLKYYKKNYGKYYNVKDS